MSPGIHVFLPFCLPLGLRILVGWAKALLRRAHHLSRDRILDGGHAEPVIGRAFARPVGFAHPTIHPTRHSGTPSSAVTMSFSVPTGVRSMFLRYASVFSSVAGTRPSVRLSSAVRSITTPCSTSPLPR